jgi:hypothetical protein
MLDRKADMLSEPEDYTVNSDTGFILSWRFDH